MRGCLREGWRLRARVGRCGVRRLEVGAEPRAAALIEAGERATLRELRREELGKRCHRVDPRGLRCLKRASLSRNPRPHDSPLALLGAPSTGSVIPRLGPVKTCVKREPRLPRSSLVKERGVKAAIGNFRVRSSLSRCEARAAGRHGRLRLSLRTQQGRHLPGVLLAERRHRARQRPGRVRSCSRAGSFKVSVRGGTDASIGARGGCTIGAAVKATSARRLDFVLLAGASQSPAKTGSSVA